MEETFEYTDRYQATGRPYPKALTVCPGQCEGMGCYPHRAHEPLPSYYEKYPHMVSSVRATYEDETEHERREVARIQEEEGVAEDGYYFVTCADCRGRGTIPLWRGIWRLPRSIWRALSFVKFAMSVKPRDTGWAEHTRIAFSSAFRNII